MAGRIHRIYFPCLAFAVFIATRVSTLAAPAQVIVIRHAEKPEEGNELNERGRERAEALVGFFEHNPAVTEYGAPAAIYAAAPKNEDGSLRSIETVEPLASNLGIKIRSNYTKKQYRKMTQEIMKEPRYSGHAVLISWEHTVIPEIIRQFGWDSAPDKWNDDVFDRAWLLEFDGEKPSAFKDIPQHLLPGDSSK